VFLLGKTTTMASKTGSFLRQSDRQKLLRDLLLKGELINAAQSIQKEAEASQTQNSSICQPTNTVSEAESFGTGCLACGEDDDHANLLLCEACNAEYHTYCLEPPLRAVPTGDWYCGMYNANCKSHNQIMCNRFIFNAAF